MGRKYQYQKAGKWIQPDQNGHRMACCDCGLVHAFDFKVHKGKVLLRAFLDSRATGQIRHHMIKNKDGVFNSDVEAD